VFSGTNLMLRRLFMVLFAANCLFAQSSPAPTQSDAQNKISINSNLVVLPVTVKNQFGDLVPDLQESEFHIFDNNVEQSIDVFTQESFPISKQKRRHRWRRLSAPLPQASAPAMK
jgi:hypothetical protein